jgi:hypothetical protein
MKIHRAWIRVTAVAATTIATFGGELAVGQGQYGPYAGAPQYAPYPATVAPYGVAPNQTVQVPVYPTATLPTTAPVSTYSVTAPQYAPYPATPQPVYGPAQQQSVQQQPAHVAALSHYANSMAQQNGNSSRVAPRYQAPNYQQAQSPAYYPQLAQKSPDLAPANMSVPPVTSHLNTHENLPAPSNMNMVPPQGDNSPYPTTNGYMASDPGCTTCNAGYGSGYGYGNGGYGAVDGCMDDCCDGGGTRWFGGVYGLYMTRTQGPYRAYTAGVDTDDTGTPYFPSGDDVENYSDCPFLVPHWRGGVEVRLGATFGIGDGCDYGDDCGYGGSYGNGGGCDPCGCEPCCQPCCQQMYAWEVGWWGLDNEVQQQYVDGPLAGNFRYYGMVNYAGLEYDDGDGGGSLPVNDFYNYQIPITGVGTETVLAQRVRTNFSCQNLELNMLRLPLLTGCCSYDSCAPAFTLTGLCGVRYFRFDDDLEFGTEWATAANPTFNGWGNSPNELFHDIQMENNLVGFQLGANMNYVVASRWNAFWDTSFGVYNNYITQSQRMYNPINGNAIFTQDGREADVNSTKNDVAFLGEMRIGGGYLFTPNWRGIIAYRAVALSGVALAPYQIKPEYGNWDQTARIDADGSLIVHGIQAGIECNY